MNNVGGLFSRSAEADRPAAFGGVLGGPPGLPGLAGELGVPPGPMGLEGELPGPVGGVSGTMTGGTSGAMPGDEPGPPMGSSGIGSVKGGSAMGPMG